ncbi:protein serine/threonine phosphatase [[Leptolyngbya] sp. PCC 7376]|uniref:PP2C family protein-serine/threonine phosphatase n=1 Tax=[Leptolyngbya] sp. PCC 7376 TaxID=111781 RepID=UPI00029F374F|nr:protein phosphatase 2C domain-containing protein [[Leptolyngbya] sp. PCC 7376]AFY39727.1 protein serine/threonine phosphatase [[Leptolyngbya] sp. PCC 7376]
MSSSSATAASFLRASGSLALHFQISDLVADRYRVVAPQIWQDTKPELLPICEHPSAIAKLYGKLYPRQLHVPRVYDICPLPEGELLLLDNIPVSDNGEILPALASIWVDSSPLRQLYWLWQILDLWEDLQEVNAVSTVLLLENIRVDGWCIRVMELIEDPEDSEISLKNIAESWRSLQIRSSQAIRADLETLLAQLEEPEVALKDIQVSLNNLLIAQSSQQLLRIKVTAATETGQEPEINEDHYFPTATEQETDNLANHLLMVCDGIAGHEGGEIASQLAIQSLKLQLTGLLNEIAIADDVLQPHVVMQQLAAYIRVANNVITARNDEQGRASRKRMATTLTLALQLPQKLNEDDSGIGNGHELYIANVGDSRAYWLTETKCLCLTVDDDVVSREVQAGRSLYRSAKERVDAAAITQALGTRDGTALHPTIRRFILDEDGVLVVCSDGLSDNGFLEENWQTFAPVIIQERLTPEMMLQALMGQAVDKNTEDNITAAIAFYGITPQHPVVINAGELTTLPESGDLLFEPLAGEEIEEQTTAQSEDSEEDQAPSTDDDDDLEGTDEGESNSLTLIIFGLIALVVVTVALALGLDWLVRRNQSPQQPSTPEIEQPIETDEN